MSKRLWVLPVLAAVLVASCGAAFAAMPSLDGPTGIVALPNALVAPVGSIEAAGSYQKFRVSELGAIGTYGVGVVDDDVAVWGVQALAGVADGAELWAAYSTVKDELDTKVWGIGGKFQVAKAAMSGVDVAIGASYRRAKGDESFLANVGAYEEPVIETVTFDQTARVYDIYAVATKDLTTMAGSEWGAGTKLLGSLGVMYKKLKVTGTSNFAEFAFDDSQSLTKPFLALQFLSPEGTDFGLEYRWKDSDLDAKAVFSVVLGHDFGNGFGAQVGTTNADPLGFGSDKQNWFARVGYTFNYGAACP